jgi:hypothetical protein
MITGINTDVKYKGNVYHIQTEEKQPLIETLVYRGGAILEKKSFDYIKKFGNTLTHQEIRKLVENHHREMLNFIKNGLLDSNGMFQQNIAALMEKDNLNSLDELLIRYLTNFKLTK